MDPLTALGLAASIVQFVDFSVALIGKAAEIYKASGGATAEIENLRTMVSELQRLKSRVEGGPSPPLAGGITATSRLATQCENLAQRILTTLQEIGLHGHVGRFESVGIAAKLYRRKAKFEAFRKELDDIRHQVLIELTNSLGNGQAHAAQVLDRIVNDGQLLSSTLTTQINNLRAEIMLSLHRQSTETLPTLLRSLVEETNKISMAQQVLSGLRYDAMLSRRDMIAQAHDGTYEWVFDSPSGIDLRDWLSSSSGIFWVSGNAGSGKSTLMKLLCDHPLAVTLLHDWAGDAKLVTANHFFWSTGSPLQKSQVGLLRTLCFEILRACPDLLLLLCEQRSRSAESNQRPWSFEELSNLIDTISTQPLRSDGRGVVFCFFVDGLDEYEGDHADIIRLLKKMAASSQVKICLSSRPWNVFDDAFGSDRTRKMYMHDLNKGDIEQYVKDELYVNDRFATLAQNDHHAAEIIAEITTMAQGVFLWVVRVVRDLRNSLTNRETMHDLQRRVRELPPTLEDYFRKMFNNLDRFHSRKTAMTFLLALYAEQLGPLPLLCFSVLDPEDHTARRLITDDDVSTEDMKELEENLKRRINGWCQDLLQVHAVYSRDGKVRFKPLTVYFLHRTVADFLKSRDMFDLLHQKASADFQPSETMCNAVWILIRRQPHVESLPRNDSERDSRLAQLMYWARLCEREQLLSASITLGYLEAFLRRDFNGFFTIPCVGMPRKIESRNAFFPLVLSFHLEQYLLRRMEQDPSLLVELRPLFIFALNPATTIFEDVSLLSLRFVSELLKHGMEPNNQGDDGLDMSMWTRYLLAIQYLETSATSATILKEANRHWLVDLTRMLVSHGAERSADPDEHDVFATAFGDSTANWLSTLRITIDTNGSASHIRSFENEHSRGARFEEAKEPIATPPAPIEKNLVQSATPYLRANLSVVLCVISMCTAYLLHCII